MSFSFVTTNNIGKVRTLIGDIVEATAVLSDEEITALLTCNENDVYLAASDACGRLAMSAAKNGKKIKAGDYSEETFDSAKIYKDMQKAYKEKAYETPADDDTSEEFLTDFNYRGIITERALRGELD